MLDEIGAKDKPVITALNKTDKIGDKSLIDKALAFFINPVAISALKREGLDGLIAGIINIRAKPGQNLKSLDKNGICGRLPY